MKTTFRRGCVFFFFSPFFFLERTACLAEHDGQPLACGKLGTETGWEAPRAGSAKMGAGRTGSGKVSTRNRTKPKKKRKKEQGFFRGGRQGVGGTPRLDRDSRDFPPSTMGPGGLPTGNWATKDPRVRLEALRAFAIFGRFALARLPRLTTDQRPASAAQGAKQPVWARGGAHGLTSGTWNHTRPLPRFRLDRIPKSDKPKWSVVATPGRPMTRRSTRTGPKDPSGHSR